MQAVRSEIAEKVKEGDSGSPPACDYRGGDCECTSRGYYFVMPKMRMKHGRKAVDAGTLCAFGPFDNVALARFIGTSAFALGLRDLNTAIHSDAFLEPSQARNMQTKARRHPVRTRSASASTSASHRRRLQAPEANDAHR